MQTSGLLYIASLSLKRGKYRWLQHQPNAGADVRQTPETGQQKLVQKKTTFGRKLFFLK